MVKVISVSEKAYAVLKERKGDKSFSEVIVGLAQTGKKEHLLDAINRIGKQEELADAVEKVYRQRNRFKFKTVKW